MIISRYITSTEHINMLTGNICSCNKLVCSGKGKRWFNKQ